MANQHFGNLGDIWKHLPLAEILRIAQPDQYLESHAGAASYPLTRGGNRDFGVYHFLAHAEAQPALRESAYRRLLKEMAGVNEVPGVYPGSAFVAMWVLRNRAVQRLFCDIDADSLGTISEAARTLEASHGVVECITGDGIATVMRRVEALSDEKARTAFLLVDPFHVTAANENGHHSLDLFAKAAGKGVMTVLWYCARTIDEREKVRGDIAISLNKSGIDESALWCGEVELTAMSEPSFEAPGVGMCGLLSANLPGDAIEAAKRQGEAVAAIYEGTSLPCGLNGGLKFNESCVCCT